MSKDNIKIESNWEMSSEERKNIEKAVIEDLEKHGEKLSDVKVIKAMKDKDGNIDIDFEVTPQKFERIRRITGYLTGSVDRWNDAKKAELDDRVKHI